MDTGLKCLTCYPCLYETDGVSERCNEKAYIGLAEQGKMACSIEMGAIGKFRKRCVFLRNDPDVEPFTTSPRCFSSPMDDNQHDCVCFTEDCNVDIKTANGIHEIGRTNEDSSSQAVKTRSDLITFYISAVVIVTNQLLDSWDTFRAN